MPNPDPNQHYQTAFQPQAYLQQYYATPHITDDEQKICWFLSHCLKRANRHFHRALEFGCGPTIHHAIPLTPYVTELHLSDYLLPNLAEIQKWLNDDPDAHNWDVYIRGLLAIEGQDSDLALSQRQACLRQKLTQLESFDIRKPKPHHIPAYDLVTSFYCCEAVSQSLPDWEANFAHLSSYVAPGGVLALGVMCQANHYRVFDQIFNCVEVGIDDLQRVLPALGFPLTQTTLELYSAQDWAEQGFSYICCVWAQKAS